MSLRSLNIAPRAFLGFALIGCLMLFLGVFALNQMGKIRSATERMSQDTIPSIKSVDEFTQLSLRQRVQAYRLLLNREPQAQQQTLDAIDQRNQKIEEARAQYLKLISSPEERLAYEQYGTLLSHHRQLESQLIELSHNNQLEAMQQLLNTELMDSAEKINAVLNQLVEINSHYATVADDDAAAQYRRAFNLVVGLLVLASALTLLFAWRLIRSITQPIANALRAAEEIAEGNLTRPITVDGSDEAGRLLQAMVTMQEKLRDTLQSISGSAHQLASAAEELNSVTEEGARGLTQQNNEICLLYTSDAADE